VTSLVGSQCHSSVNESRRPRIGLVTLYQARAFTSPLRQ